MMSGAKKRVPKRRFKEFLNTSDWEQRKLGDVSNIIVGGTPSTKVKAYWEPKEVPWMSSGEINKKRIYSTDNMISEYGLNNSNASWVKENSILIALAGQGKTRGTVAINDIPLTTNQSIAAMELNKDFDAEFIFQNLNSRYEELRRVSSGDGARGGLNKEILSNFVVPYSSISEQVKIGNFFRTIDNLIIRCQRKLDKLQATKKALLQEMFPEEGQDKPKRRFKYFTDAWEQRKLGDVIASLYNGQTPSRSDKANWEGDIPWLTSGELNRGVVNHSIEKITQQGRDDANLKIVPKGTVVIAITGLEAAGTRGNCAKLGFDTTLNQSCMAIYPKSEFLDPDFLFQWYIAVGEEYGIKYTQGTKQQSYNAELIKILPISVPRVTEQRKITRILDSFDDIITLHQCKLDKLKNLKQAYLNEMFV